MASPSDRLKYIETILVHRILENLPGEKFLRFTVNEAQTLNGFMSAMYNLVLTTEKADGKERVHNIIAKFMKGDKPFRESSRSYTQFANEIFIYSKVLPYYETIVQNSGSSIKVKDWIPHVYYSRYGLIDGLGDGTSEESVLAVEDLSPRGYRCGPRSHLDRQHLLLMAKMLAEYHSLTYVMKIRNDSKLESFRKEIIPLPFVIKKEQHEQSELHSKTDDIKIEGDKNSTNLYDVLYNVAFKRFFSYFDRKKSSYDNNEKYVEDVGRLRNKYGSHPTLLLERIRQTNDQFTAILHGDFCRNNVLFQYDNEGFNNPKGVKMIDFQELRYGTPAIDLSFFMYMNMDPAIRDDFWMELLTFYHETLFNSLVKILNVHPEHECLKQYRFDEFYAHFLKNAFYGAMIVIHFLPWMLCNEDECAKISHLFQTDMEGKEFHDLSLILGGDEANEIIAKTVMHASKMGYMDNL